MPPKQPSNTFRTGLIQLSCSSDVADNTARAVERVRNAAAKGAQVICLQELFYSQYLCQQENPDLFDLATEIPGPLTDQFGEIAKELEVVIILPVFEKRARGLYHNTAAIIDADGSLLGSYRKMHIPDDPQFYEKFYFTPGDLGFRAWNTRYGCIGVCICWDQWFPEAARLTALAGADVIFYPTAIGWLPSEKETCGERQFRSWETVQRGHAIANGCYIAAANRVGHEAPAGGDGIEFWGRSFVADPSGEIVSQAASDQEAVLITEIDPAQIEDQRRLWPFLRDRRIDAYSGISTRHLNP